MSISLGDVVVKPENHTQQVSTKDGSEITLRPLKKSDFSSLSLFIKNLSKTTRSFYSYTKSSKTIALEICKAINKYDKLRFVLEINQTREIIGVVEISFDIPIKDAKRYKRYRIDLNTNTDCRIGLVLSDIYQNRNLGTQIIPHLMNTAALFEQKHIILWGGVHTNNARAIRFYQKNGFKQLGKFINQDGVKCFDMILDLKRSS